MKTKTIACLAFLNGFFNLQVSLPAQEAQNDILPNDPARAWAEVEKVHQALWPPDGWQTQQPTADQVAAFQKQMRITATSYADKALEFMRRFPTNENLGDARRMFVYALGRAVAAGDSVAEKRIEEFVFHVVADESIPEDDRVGVLLYSGNVPLMKKLGMRLFTEEMSKLHDEFETALVESLRMALKRFPTSSMIYTFMVAVAQRSEKERQVELATEIHSSPDAPSGAKTLAGHILKGTKPYEIGKPLDIRFTALDGREVDVAKLAGKVVLVEFWSTTCGQCIAEMPEVKAVHEKLHPLGFEVVAISLDDKESAVRRFIKEKELPWPQHFDGKGWENYFAVKYGIFSIPTKWLVDKRGNLRYIHVGNLEGQVAMLLDEEVSQ